MLKRLRQRFIDSVDHGSDSPSNALGADSQPTLDRIGSSLSNAADSQEASLDEVEDEDDDYEDDEDDDDFEDDEDDDDFEDEEDEDSEDGESDQEDDTVASSWFDRDSAAFFVSMAIHVFAVVSLASITIVTQPELIGVLINSEPIVEELAPLDVVTEIAYSDTPSDEFGADSIGTVDMALSSAPLLADMSIVESVELDIEIPNGNIDVSRTVEKAMGLTLSQSTVRGATGVGTTGTDGAVDRVTYEILQSLEERPTLVVWVFDSSISMVKRRQEIRDRFDRIYQQLGIVQEEKRKREGDF